MHVMRIILPAVLVIGAVAAWVWFAFTDRRELAFHGFVQGELVFVGSEEAGRLVELRITPGGEPGTHNHRPGVMDSGLSASFVGLAPE